MKTLNEQYQLIKEGKGHKGVFLTEAKRQFPNYIRNAATFEEAALILKQREIIHENVTDTSVSTTVGVQKESFELAFNNFLTEAKDPQVKAKEVKAKKVKSQEEPEKAEAKKTSKQVEEDLDHNYDNKDDKNPDNLIFDQIMMGYYAEMKDPKNSEKTMQQLKDIVFKNLAKDSIYYTKNAQFGVKDLGYSVDHPGLGEPKEAKGKYKASGYGDLNESKLRKVISQIIREEMEEAYQMPSVNTSNSKGAGGKRFIPKQLPFPVNVRKRFGDHMIYNPGNGTFMEEEMSSLNESVEKDLADINKEAEHEVLQTKLDKIDALIDQRRSKLGKLDEDEDMKALTDKKKVKELEKDIKKLEVARKKIEKMLHKTKGKKKEMIDEMEEEEPNPELLKALSQADEMYEGGLDIDTILVKFNPRMRNDIERHLRMGYEGTDND